MTVHMVTRVGEEDYQVTLSRDDAGNYIADSSEASPHDGVRRLHALQRRSTIRHFGRHRGATLLTD